MTSPRIQFSFLASLLLLIGCFLKSDKTGEADDVTDFLLCRTAKGDFLITHEEIFHAQSKSYNNGISQITGYSDYRYTIRDLPSGKTTMLFVTGDRQNDVALLGFDGRNLWCYNAAKDGGVEARDPVSMQVVTGRQKIEEANPSLKGKLSTPKVYEANQYYGFDYLNQKVIMTDLQGIFYSMDPITLKANKLNAKPSEFPDVNNAKSTSADVAPEQSVRMEGDLRKYVRLNDSVKSDVDFLNGEILIEKDPMHLADLAHSLLHASYSTLQMQRTKCDSFLKAYTFLQDESQWYRDYKNHDVVYRYQDLKRQLDDMQRDSAEGNYKLFQFLSNAALGCDSNILYVAHANNLTDTSSLLISKIKLSGKTLTTEWTTLVPGIFFNPDKGIQKNPMKEVFKSGSPEFRFEQYGVKGNILCGVKMLFVFAIDTGTGKLLWKQQL